MGGGVAGFSKILTMLGIPKGLFIVAVSLVFRGAVYYNPLMLGAVPSILTMLGLMLVVKLEGLVSCPM